MENNRMKNDVRNGVISLAFLLVVRVLLAGFLPASYQWAAMVIGALFIFCALLLVIFTSTKIKGNGIIFAVVMIIVVIVETAGELVTFQSKGALSIYLLDCALIIWSIMPISMIEWRDFDTQKKLLFLCVVAFGGALTLTCFDLFHVDALIWSLVAFLMLSFGTFMQAYLVYRNYDG